MLLTQTVLALVLISQIAAAWTVPLLVLQDRNGGGAAH